MITKKRINDTSKAEKKIKKEKSAEKQIGHKLIEKSVIFINEKVAETFYKGSLEIGEFLLKNFFKDDIEFASSRNPRKPKSYKMLCEHEDLAVHPSTLSVMVRVAAQERILVKENVDTDKLNYSQRAELIKVDDKKTKLELAALCIKQSVPVKELKQIVYTKRKLLGQAPKNTPSLMANKFVANIEQMLKASQLPEFCSDLDNLKKLRKNKRDNLYTKNNELLEKLKYLTKECNKLKKNIDKIQ